MIEIKSKEELNEALKNFDFSKYKMPLMVDDKILYIFKVSNELFLIEKEKNEYENYHTRLSSLDMTFALQGKTIRLLKTTNKDEEQILVNKLVNELEQINYQEKYGQSIKDFLYDSKNPMIKEKILSNNPAYEEGLTKTKLEDILSNIDLISYRYTMWDYYFDYEKDTYISEITKDCRKKFIEKNKNNINNNLIEQVCLWYFNFIYEKIDLDKILSEIDITKLK